MKFFAGKTALVRSAVQDAILWNEGLLDAWADVEGAEGEEYRAERRAEINDLQSYHRARWGKTPTEILAEKIKPVAVLTAITEPRNDR